MRRSAGIYCAGVIAPALGILLIGSGQPAPAQVAPVARHAGLEVGGSNYVMYSLGDYPRDPNGYYKPGNLKPVLGAYHEHPFAVRKQMQTMRADGQQKIAFFMHYNHISPKKKDEFGRQGPLVDATGGAPSKQLEANIRQVMAITKELGFNEIQFRFAEQGQATPSNWKEWREDQYQENKNFIFNTRAVVENALAGSSIKRLYDLAVERGGIERGHNLEYTRRLWADYTRKFGAADSYGFSFATAPKRFLIAVRVYDRVGVRPKTYAFDIYDNMYKQLGMVSREMQAAGEHRKPVIIQECYYNDREAYAEILRARRDLRLDIRTVMQWQKTRHSKVPHFNVTFPSHYDSYLGK